MPVATIRRPRAAPRRWGARGATPRLPAPARQPNAATASPTTSAWRPAASTPGATRPAEGHRHLAVSSPSPPVPVNPAALSAPSRIKVLVSPPCQVKSFDPRSSAWGAGRLAGRAPSREGLGTLRGFPSHDVSRCCWTTWESAVFSGSRRAYVYPVAGLAHAAASMMEGCRQATAGCCVGYWHFAPAARTAQARRPAPTPARWTYDAFASGAAGISDSASGSAVQPQPSARQRRRTPARDTFCTTNAASHWGQRLASGRSHDTKSHLVLE